MSGAGGDETLRPTPLEVAAGRMFGGHAAAPGIAHVDDRGRAPLAALEGAMLPALEKTPCVVAFSGGRDSSSVLAAATRAARREGLPAPVPVTLRVRDAPRAQESEWQERVVRHLGLHDWQRYELGEELDRTGPLSVSVLRRHGVLYPPNTFLQLPLLEAARGGCLLSGLGGDELFAGWRWRNHADALARRRRPRSRDGLRVAYAASPRALRKWRETRRYRLEGLVWLRPDAARAASRLVAEARAVQPRSWARWVDWSARRRSVSAARWSLSLLASETDTVLVHPLLEPTFLAALARTGGRLGFGDRTAGMRAVFHDLLPDDVLCRATKAEYGEAFWGRGTREFAAGWSGPGVDPELVDPTTLKREWLKPRPHEDSAMLLHAALLAKQD
jgi:asparagine synthase (glutamine-hydrolysing)